MTDEPKQALTREARGFAADPETECVLNTVPCPLCMADFALSRKPGWEREAVRRAFEGLVTKLRSQGRSVAANQVAGAIHDTLKEMEAKDE